MWHFLSLLHSFSRWRRVVVKIKRGMVLELPFHESSETARKKAAVWRRSEARYLQDVRKNEKRKKRKRAKCKKGKKQKKRQGSKCLFLFYTDYNHLLVVKSEKRGKESILLARLSFIMFKRWSDVNVTDRHVWQNCQVHSHLTFCVPFLMLLMCQFNKPKKPTVFLLWLCVASAYTYMHSNIPPCENMYMTVFIIWYVLILI